LYFRFKIADLIFSPLDLLLFEMVLSVIIVNYNVKHLLEKCLYSVQAALKDFSGEIIVVDNASTDSSIKYLQPLFPSVKFIANAVNKGFGSGCNTGFQQSSGDFILFLNPDTIVPPDCFEKCLAFIQTKKEAGALGVKMLDGSGNYLKESKRNFPYISASFFKMTGLASLFPHSKLFAAYYAGHLSENEIHEVDVLAGAFMLIKRNVFAEVKGFDEDFFMYGEDIDLSYRIQKAGYKNYYFPETSITHYKGGSTKKRSMAHIRSFYGAMSIFVDKHYSGGTKGIFKFVIKGGIWFFAALSVIGNIFRSR
jgi:O-antigen biosynthesis protein